MRIRTLEMNWLDERESFTQTELAHISALSPSELDELVDYGALTPLSRQASAATERLFGANCVMGLRTVSQLRTDFDLDLFTMAIVLGYLDRIDALERQLQAMGVRQR